LTQEEQRRVNERREYIDAAVSYLSNYSWSYFITLTFRQSLGQEAIDRAIRRFARCVHENVFGEFDRVSDVRDLYGVRYFPAIERGCCGEKRLHAHVLIAGGEVLGERLDNARWKPWLRWWSREYGGLRIEKPRAQGDVAAYCTKYVLKGEESGFELCSTWADERDRRKRAEAPLLEERKIGIDVTRSADLEKSAFRGETPRGTGPTSKGSGKVCHRCGLVSGCACWEPAMKKPQCFCGRISMGPLCQECSRCSECCSCAKHGKVRLIYHNKKFGPAPKMPKPKRSGQVLDAPEPDARGLHHESGVCVAAPLSSQMELPMQQQLFLPVQASANKSVALRFSSRREKYLHRLWGARLNNAALTVPCGN
jgi:hypothetical protein